MSLPDASGPNTSGSAISPAAFPAHPAPAGFSSTERFVDRRGAPESEDRRTERRQFGSSHSGLTDDGRELALAIDRYKIEHHRRYLTCDEMLMVLATLGYSKQVS